MSNPREPHEHNYVNSEPDAEDEGQPHVVPIPQGTEPGTWRPVLRQYLMTLNTPKTRGGYEKCVHYFFTWPGVPEYLYALTFELLNSYRYMLTQRCEPGYQPPPATKPPAPAASISASTALVPVPSPRENPAEEEAEQQWQSGQGYAWHRGWHRGMGRERSLTGKLAPGTVGARLTALRSFLVWCVRHHYLSHLTTDEIRTALKPPFSASTVLYEHAIVWEWEFEEWLDCVGTPVFIDAQDRRGYLVNGPMRRGGRAAAASHRTKVTRGEYGARWLGRHTGERDVLVVRLLLITLIRNAELRSLNIGNLQVRRDASGREEWSLHLAAAQTKGRHSPRDLPLPLDWIRDYSVYLASTGRRWTETDSPLFVNYLADPDRAGRDYQRDDRMSESSVGAIFLRANVAWQRRHPTDTREFSAHGMRRSGATAYRNGNPTANPPRPPMPLEMVSQWLGHKNIGTTIRYLASGDALRERASFVLNPTRSHTPNSANAAGLSESAEPA
jgi:integrase